MATLKQKMDKKTDKSGDCWNWTGATTNFKDRDNYPVMWNGKKVVRAHRLAYELHHDVCLTSDIIVRHLCHNTLCVNPDHLLTGTHADNVADRVAAGRSSKAIGERSRKLLDEDYIEIKSLAGVIPQAQIADMFGVSRGYVSQIHTGRAKCLR